MCGQAILGCMDTGMVFVMMSLDQPDRSFTTVSLNTNFERGVPEDIGTVTFDAYVTKPGRSLVFGQIDLFSTDRQARRKFHNDLYVVVNMHSIIDPRNTT